MVEIEVGKVEAVSEDMNVSNIGNRHHESESEREPTQCEDKLVGSRDSRSAIPESSRPRLCHRHLVSTRQASRSPRQPKRHPLYQRRSGLRHHAARHPPPRIKRIHHAYLAALAGVSTVV